MTTEHTAEDILKTFASSALAGEYTNETEAETLQQLYEACMAEAETYTKLEQVMFNKVEVKAVPLEALARVFGVTK